MLGFRKKRLLKAHAKLGFPRFSTHQQCEMLVNQDYTPIENLTAISYWDSDLLDHYITLSVEDLTRYLLDIDFLKDKQIEQQTLQDGVWIIPTGKDQYELIDQERGILYGRTQGDLYHMAVYSAMKLLALVPKHRNNSNGFRTHQ